MAPKATGNTKSFDKTQDKQVTRATSMADLMKSVESLVPLSKGAIVEGVITKLAPQEITVDIDSKSEAVVLEKDRNILKTLLSTIKVGDKVSVQILNPESETGNPVVSLRRFLSNTAWEMLKSLQDKGQPVDGVVKEMTRGGYLIETPYGISGFLPTSQLQYIPGSQPLAAQSATEVLGKKLSLYVLELNKESRKVIFSQKPVLAAKDFQEAAKQFKPGEKITAIVSNITNFGVFLLVSRKKEGEKMEYLDGLIHISEVSWEDVDNLFSLFEVGQEVECIVIKADIGAKRLDLSIKRLSEDPFEKIAQHMSLDQKVKARVEKITSTGVLLSLLGLEDGLKAEATIRKEKIPPNLSYEPGQELSVVISEVDSKKHKIFVTPVLKEKPIGYR